MSLSPRSATRRINTWLASPIIPIFRTWTFARIAPITGARNIEDISNSVSNDWEKNRRLPARTIDEISDLMAASGLAAVRSPIETNARWRSGRQSRALSRIELRLSKRVRNARRALLVSYGPVRDACGMCGVRCAVRCVANRIFDREFRFRVRSRAIDVRKVKCRECVVASDRGPDDREGERERASELLRRDFWSDGDLAAAISERRGRVRVSRSRSLRFLLSQFFFPFFFFFPVLLLAKHARSSDRRGRGEGEGERTRASVRILFF